MAKSEQGLVTLFEKDPESAAEQELPFGFEESALFDVTAFRTANPHVARVIYEGPQEHTAEKGTILPTHSLIIWFDDNYSNGITIRDFHGKTGDATTDFSWQGSIEELGDAKISFTLDSESSTIFRVTKNTSDEDRPENILGVRGGISRIIANLQQPGDVRPRQQNAYNGISIAILKTFVADFAALDFSSTPLPRVRNLTRGELRERGIEPLKK